MSTKSLFIIKRLLIIFFVFFFFTPNIFASTFPITGKAKVLNTGAYLDFSGYSSNVVYDNSNGNLSGYGFLEDLGWVAFGVTDNSSGPVSINLTNGAVSGKAKVLNTGAYLDFSGYNSNVSANLSNGLITGYVFSEDIGWINFSDTGVSTSSFVPSAPSNFSGNVSSEAVINWTWTDNSNNELGFRVEDENNINISGNLSAGTTGWQESNLTANTTYVRHVRAYNTSGDNTTSNTTVATLSTPPSNVIVTSSRNTGVLYTTNPFIFTNTSGFGVGSVQYYLYAWNTSSTHTWLGSETQWTTGTLSLNATSNSNNWTLHLKGYNSENIANGTLSLGQYYYDSTTSPPPTSTPTPTPTSSPNIYTLADTNLSSNNISSNIGEIPDPSNSVSLYFERPNYAKIEFTNPIDLTNPTVASWVQSLVSKIDMSTQNQVGLDADLVKSLINTNARITIYNVTFQNPKILVDGVEDTQGIVSDIVYDQQLHTLTFSVAHFTTFLAVENSTSSNSADTSNQNLVKSCSDTIPINTPDLFQINTTKTSAKIFINPIKKINYYFVSFSTKPNSLEHGALVKLSDVGIQNFTVTHLKPNTTYYFKVRGQNGCSPGNWSSILSAKTNNKKYYSKKTTLISNLKKLFSNIIKTK